MKILIMRDQLIAALCTAGKADIRPYLNGVYLEATNLETRLSSTDGHTMALQRADAKGDNQVEGVIRMIVPRSAIEKVKNHKILRTIEINDEGGKWGVVDFGTRTSFEPVEGCFPDVRRVLPAKPNGEPAQFDPALIAQFAKAAVALGAVVTKRKVAPVAITHNGMTTGASLVSIGIDSEYIGAIMPFRFTVPETPPAWATAQLEVEEESLV